MVRNFHKIYNDLIVVLFYKIYNEFTKAASQPKLLKFTVSLVLYFD